MHILVFFVVLLIIAAVIYGRERHRHNLLARQYNKCHCVLTANQVDNIISSVVKGPYGDIVEMYDYLYEHEDIPLGRANAFLNYHNESIHNTEPYLYMCKRSLKDNEFREYGFMITRNGIYYSEDNPKNAGRSERRAALPGTQESYSFAGLAGIDERFGHLVLRYFNPASRMPHYSFIKPCCEDEKILLLNLFSQIVSNDIGIIMSKGNIADNAEDVPELVSRELSGVYYYNALSKPSDYVDAGINQQTLSKGFGAAGVQGAQPRFNAFYKENKNYMNGSQGHGYAAEYANNTADRARFKNVENAAQELVNGHQAKNGADRIVNGIEIQTKYCSTASGSIGAAFEDNQAKYIRADGSGKMMVIEVPRDQYKEVLKYMQERIDNGEVPNVDRGERAENYVKKGIVTYDESVVISKAGSVEGLFYDALAGAVCCSSMAGISAVLAFASSIWNGQTIEDAAKQSLNVGLKVLGKGTAIYSISMQLSRSNFVDMRYYGDKLYNIFAPASHQKAIAMSNYKFAKNPVYDISKSITGKINKSSIAKTDLVKSLGLDSMKSIQLISGTVTIAVTFGPDIARALSGKISTKQLIKNSTISAAGIAGAVVGSALVPEVPILGSAIGGALASGITKVTMDQFIEDDAKEMFIILKEEFLDTVMLFGLSQDELDMVVKRTVGSRKITKEFRKMYKADSARDYARHEIMLTAIEEVISARSLISEAAYISGVQLLLEGGSAA